MPTWALTRMVGWWLPGWWDTHPENHMCVYWHSFFLMPFKKRQTGDGSLLWLVRWVPKQRNFPKIAGSHHLGVYNPCDHQLRGVVAVRCLDQALLHCPSLQASAYAMMAGILEKFRFKQLLIPEFDPEFKGSQARAKSNLST